MTYDEFKNLIVVDIKCKEDNYVSKAKLVGFHYGSGESITALVFNEETKRFKNIPIREILRVYENPVSEFENDEFTELWVRLFGDDSVIMDTFKSKYTIRKENNNVIISPKDADDKTEYVLVREMNDVEKSVFEEIDGCDKQKAHDINEMRLARYRFENGYSTNEENKIKGCIPVKEAMEEATRFMSTHVCPEVDKDAVKKMTEDALSDCNLMSKAKEYYQNAPQTEAPNTEFVPDEDWKYNGGSC